MQCRLPHVACVSDTCTPTVTSSTDSHVGSRIRSNRTPEHFHTPLKRSILIGHYDNVVQHSIMDRLIRMAQMNSSVAGYSSAASTNDRGAQLQPCRSAAWSEELLAQSNNCMKQTHWMPYPISPAKTTQERYEHALCTRTAIESNRIAVVTQNCFPHNADTTHIPSPRACGAQGVVQQKTLTHQGQ
jgi:hypothetical protein